MSRFFFFFRPVACGFVAISDAENMQVKDNLLAYSQHKFASNVVEKCLQYGTKEERGVLVQHLLYGHSDGCVTEAMSKRDC